MEGIPRAFGFEDEEDNDHRNSIGLQKTKTSLLKEGTHKVLCALGPRARAMTSIGAGQAYLLVLERTWGGRELAVVQCGDKDSGGGYAGNVFIEVSSPRGHNFGT